MEFRLPELGEGIENGTVVSVAVKVGDTVRKDQELFTLETDKASLPVPSPAEGKLTQFPVKAGDKINVGAVIAIIETAGGPSPVTKKADTAPASTQDRMEAPTPPAQTSAQPEPAEAPAVAAKKTDGAEAPRPNGKQSPTPSPAAPDQPARAKPAAAAVQLGNGAPSKDFVPAGPATRRLARELGVSLSDISGSARGGRVTLDDVKLFVRKRITQPTSATSGAFSIPPLPDFSKYGPIEKKPVSNLRKKIAENLTISWHVAPAVTQFDQADITELEAGRKRSIEGSPKGAAKITMTILAIRAVVAALKEFPNFNGSLDVNAGNLILKQYFHIGIAVDTERGLVVPVIRDADKKSLRDLAKEVSELAEKARASKLTIDEMRGGTFTITNLGGIGGTAFSPIINYPEVAILGMARSGLQPVIRDGKVELRLMLPLCLTYDHRVIDGADGARFTSRLAQMFSDPIRLLMES